MPPRSRKRAAKPDDEETRPGEGEEDRTLPPRGVAHPSEKKKWNTLFYRVLLLLFIGLTAGLLYWGFQMFPT
ncbi:hypothetical protein DUZ99_10655 [Xylanibacillus composti]|nr:hypothetical protein [Xylanibacillus composti]